jgi:DNA-binding Xre family transcriptional regulator
MAAIGRTQTELAAETGLDRGTIKRIVDGEPVRMKTLRRLHAAIDEKYDDIIEIDPILELDSQEIEFSFRKTLGKAKSQADWNDILPPIHESFGRALSKIPADHTSDRQRLREEYERIIRAI